MLQGGERDKDVYDYLKHFVGKWVCVGTLEGSVPVHVTDVLDQSLIADRVVCRENGPGGFLYRIKEGQSILGLGESIPITPCGEAYVKHLLEQGTPYQRFLGQFVELERGDATEWGVLRAIYPHTVELLPYTTGRRRKVPVKLKGKTNEGYARELYLHKTGIPRVIALGSISSIQVRDQKQLEERLAYLNKQEKKALRDHLREQLAANASGSDNDLEV